MRISAIPFLLYSTNLSLKYTLPLSFIFIPFNVKKRVDLPAPFLPTEEIFLQADELRKYDLRLPRIAHLMEILRKCDSMAVDDKYTAAAFAAA